MFAVITVENLDRKNYFVISGRSHCCLRAKTGCDIESDEFKLVRAYSQNRVVDFFLKILFFILAVFFVFLETDYENGETLLISLKYKGKAKSENLDLKILPSALLNIEKKGCIAGEFKINKHLMIAHLLSVFIYAIVVTGFIFYLGLFVADEKTVKIIFFILSGISVFICAGLIGKSISRCKKTLKFLHEYYDNYVY